jgi:hypothetical protein
MQFLIFMCNFKGILNRLDWLCKISSFVSVVVIYVRFQIELSIHNQAVYLYISDIPELVVPIMIFLIERLLLTRKVLGQGFQVVRLKSSLRNFYDHHHVLITEYLCYKKPRMCSVGINNNPILSSVMAYHRLCNRSNTIGATCRSGTAYPSSAHEFAPIAYLSY